jgi:two-component system chemotaxis sensor kinase CheA
VLGPQPVVSRLDDAPRTGWPGPRSGSALVTSELQEQVMKTRMQPGGRDLEQSCPGSCVTSPARSAGRCGWRLEGRDTGLDRSVLEAIKDPPDAPGAELGRPRHRAAGAGGSRPASRPRASSSCGAYHEAGQVHLEIIDDGAGISPEKIVAKALERGLVTKAQVQTMTARDIAQLIFLPGFSTAGEVTNVSGRGRRHGRGEDRIEGIGGSVDVNSTPGVGTTMRLTIPLTLAIIPALTIGCAGRRYAVPQVSVLELVRLAGEHARGGIELISGAPVYRLRGTLLPLVRLDEQMELVPSGTLAEEASHEPSEGRAGAAGSSSCCRPSSTGSAWWSTTCWTPRRSWSSRSAGISRACRSTPGRRSSATARWSSSWTRPRSPGAPTCWRTSRPWRRPRRRATSGRIDPVLVVQLAGGRQSAIPLDMVTRLEGDPDEVDRAGRRARGGAVPRHIMPLVRLANLLGSYAEDGDGGHRAAGGLHPRRAERRLRGRTDPGHRDRAGRHPQRHRRPRPARQRRGR